MSAKYIIERELKKHTDFIEDETSGQVSCTVCSSAKGTTARWISRRSVKVHVASREHERSLEILKERQQRMAHHAAERDTIHQPHLLRHVNNLSAQSEIFEETNPYEDIEDYENIFHDSHGQEISFSYGRVESSATREYRISQVDRALEEYELSIENDPLEERRHSQYLRGTSNTLESDSGEEEEEESEFEPDDSQTMQADQEMGKGWYPYRSKVVSPSYKFESDFFWPKRDLSGYASRFFEQLTTAAFKRSTNTSCHLRTERSRRRRCAIV